MKKFLLLLRWWYRYLAIDIRDNRILYLLIFPVAPLIAVLVIPYFAWQDYKMSK